MTGLTLRAPIGAVLLFILATPAFASPATLVTGTPWLNGPGKEYAALGDLEPGTHVDLIWCGTKANYCLVERHGKKGWVPLDVLNVRPGGGGGTDDVASNNGKIVPGADPQAAAAATEIAPYSPPGGKPTFSEVEHPSLIKKF